MSTEENESIWTDADRFALERYLQQRGWEEVAIPTPLLTQWLHRSSRTGVQIPQAPDLIDFGWLMERAVEQVARVEGRTAAQMLEALRDAMTCDIVRIRLSGAAELPLQQGVEAMDALPRLLQAAALAENRPSAVYASRLPHGVKDYMAQLKLKQTEVGSFVLRIASPLGELPEEPPSLQYELPNLPPLPPPPPPWGRRVVERLARSVAAAAAAAEEAAREARLGPLEKTVKDGVSANLLEALATFGDVCEASFTVEVDWAVAWEAPELPRHVTFDRAWTPLLREAAAAFRKRPEGPRPVRLKGGVAKLDRDPGEGEGARPGSIQLWTHLEARPLKVEAELSGADYQLAAEAHTQDTPIWIRGMLEQQGKKWVLRGAYGVELWNEQDTGSEEEGEGD